MVFDILIIFILDSLISVQDIKISFSKWQCKWTSTTCNDDVRQCNDNLIIM